MPILLLWGEHDSIIPVSHGEAAHEALPDSELAVLSRSGHFPQLDEPEVFLDVLQEFLAQSQPAPDGLKLWRSRLDAATSA